MADIKDVSTVIASALSEISVNGTLDVEMDGDSEVVNLGTLPGDPVEVVVTVKPVEPEADVPGADRAPEGATGQ
jgi:hypothetical protein